MNKNSRLYVIGDIHGRLDLLDQLIEAIRRDVDEYGNNSLTVTLGDYIDRGPDSRGVIERLLTNPFPGRYVALKGNHEALLETFLDQGVPLERQSEQDLLWIRDEFLDSRMDFGKIIVHGHTPVEGPEVLSNRINIDTGAFATGRLTCVVPEGVSHRFIRT